MNAKDVIFIADKGFYSEENILELKKKNKLKYIIPLRRKNKLINFDPLKGENFKKDLKNQFLFQDRVIWYYEYEVDGQLIITFLDEKLREEAAADYYLRRMKTHP